MMMLSMMRRDRMWNGTLNDSRGAARYDTIEKKSYKWRRSQSRSSVTERDVLVMMYVWRQLASRMYSTAHPTNSQWWNLLVPVRSC